MASGGRAAGGSRRARGAASRWACGALYTALRPAPHQGLPPPAARPQVRLICKERLIPLYSEAGFTMVGPSTVVHGKDSWFEMRWAPGDEEGGEEEEAGDGGAAAAAAQQQQPNGAA